jgi:tetratricopeptide (TPR) repeat protein
MRRLCAITILIALSGCSSVKPPAATPDTRTPERLAEADRLVRAGCLDCLVAAYGEYDLLRAFPAARDAAVAGAVRSAGLIALREREIGHADQGYLGRARSLVASTAGVPERLAFLLDVIEAMPNAGSGSTRAPTSDLDLERMRVLRINADAWGARLRAEAGTDELAAYTYLSFTCGSSATRQQTLDDIVAPVAPFRDAPLIRFKRAICRGVDSPAIAAVLASEPRFLEVKYFQALVDVGEAPRLGSAHLLDAADGLFDEMYAWRPQWPALTQSIANIAMTSEEFERATTFYTRTLDLEPKAVDAMIGKIRALTYLGRPLEAIALADVLIADRWFVGEARYWRALNLSELERNDEAWIDVEEAGKLVINAEVPKLAGLVAYRLRRLEISRDRFELSATRNRNDCETGFYLGVVLAELRTWERTTQVLVNAAKCLELAEARYTEEIAAIRASSDPPARQAGKIARREQYIAKGRRQMATSFFDLAVASFNLQRRGDAREYAQRVADDEQFGERAREILARLK